MKIVLLMGRQDAVPSQCRLADGDDVMITEKVNRFLIRMCRYILNERKVRDSDEPTLKFIVIKRLKRFSK